METTYRAETSVGCIKPKHTRKSTGYGLDSSGLV
jgi:hypothetical protein